MTHESRQEQMSARPTPIVYVSSVRSKCQEICRWPHSRPGRDDGCDGIVKKLISAGMMQMFGPSVLGNLSYFFNCKLVLVQSYFVCHDSTSHSDNYLVR